jgi:hypothetical protein
MKKLISLAQELRAIRLGRGPETPNGANHMPDPENTEPPWQAEFARLEQAFSEVLQAIARFTGVDVPGAPPDLPEQGGVPQLDWKTLKDRIHEELEAFSAAAGAEMAKRAHERGYAALESVASEAEDRINQAASEFREKLRARLDAEQPVVELDLEEMSQKHVAELVQARTDEFAHWVWLTCQGTGTPIPAQIERLLQPYVEEATSKFTATIRQHVQETLAAQEQAVQATISGLQAQIAALEQKADAATKLLEERLSATTEHAEKTFESKIQDRVEEGLGRFQTRFGELEAGSKERSWHEQDLQLGRFQQKIEEFGNEVQTRNITQIRSRIEEIAANVMESSIQHLHQQAGDTLEESKSELKGFTQLQAEEVREKFSGLGRTMYDSLSQDAAKLADTLRGLDQKLTEIEQKHLAISEEQLSNLSKATLESLAAHIKELTDSQLEEIKKVVRDSQEKAAAQYESRLRESAESQYNDLLQRLQKEAGEVGAKAAAESKATSESMVQELSGKVTSFASVLREEAVQASSHIESSLNSSLEHYRQQLDQITHAGLEEHQKAVTETLAGLQNRLRQAAQLLALGDAQD